jgi:hypothetical protein
MPLWLHIGPEGLLLLWALILSVVVAVLAWRGTNLGSAAIATLAVALALVVWQLFAVEWTSVGTELMGASFILVPAVLLFAVSRVNWIARRAWVLVLLGPFAFVGCYVGICELCYKLMVHQS